MTKAELTEKTETLMSETHDALQLVYDETKKGSRKQFVKNPEVKALFDRFGVTYEKG